MFIIVLAGLAPCRRCPLSSNVRRPMSDCWLRYVPIDPLYRPNAEQAKVAERLLASFLPQSQEVRSEFSANTVFIDPGSNWSGVHCSSCGADAEAWWGESMALAAQANFEQLTIDAPCCGNTVSLNELNYALPCAFGRYALEAMNPNERGLTSEQSGSLARALGCDVREIPVHL